MYNIIPVNGRLFAVNTTTQSYFVHVVLDSIVSKEEIMRELCRAVVCVEREGAIVTSVHEVTADGRRPRVAYRQSQEYKLARKEPEQHKLQDKSLLLREQMARHNHNMPVVQQNGQMQHAHQNFCIASAHEAKRRSHTIKNQKQNHPDITD